MRQTIDPDFEFSWGPALWAAVTLVVGTAAGLVLFSDFGWFGCGAVLAGLTASFRSDYYDHSGNSAVVGVLLANGVVFLTVALVGVVAAGTGGGVVDYLFVTVSLGFGWTVVVMMVFLPVTYISAVVGDFVRKKVGGRIGYNT